MANLPLRRILAGLALALAARGFADLDGSYIVPRDHAAIRYDTDPVQDPVSVLQERLRGGKVKMAYEEEHGYLSSLLKALDVPTSSQVLVFSKTSFQAPRISPR